MAEALYRKYRPQVFEDVVGQEPIERTLKNALAQDKVSHAYLFCGPRGTGKTTTARLLAKALLCERGPSADPDGTCEDCRLIAEGTHPDVYELDAASRTGVDNVREEIISRVQFAPTRGRFKVYIIDEVHMLSTAAFNALLKTLEEPPSHVVFILCTTDPQKVPDTIHSRCQRFDFRRIAPESIVSRLGAICLAEEVEFEGEALDLIAHRAGGGLRDALTSLEQIIAFEGGKVTLAGAERLLGSIDTSDLAEIMAYVGKRDIANCFRWTAAYVETGADLAQFVRDMAEHVRNLYVLALAGDDVELDVGETDRRELAGELSWFGSDRASRLLGVLGDLSAELKTTSNPRLAFEVALTRMVRPDSDLTLEALAERVEALESGYSAVAHVAPGEPLAASTQVAAAFEGAPAQVGAQVGEQGGARVEMRPEVQAGMQAEAHVEVQASPQAEAQIEAQAEAQPGAQVEVEAAADVAGKAGSRLASLSNPATLQRVWQAALSDLRKEKQAYGVFFLNTSVIFDAATGGLRVVFPAKHPFAFNAVQKPEIQAALGEALARAVGENVSFRYEREGDGTAAPEAGAAGPASVRQEGVFDARLQERSRVQPVDPQAQVQAQAQVEARAQGQAQGQPRVQPQPQAQVQAQPQAQVQPQPDQRAWQAGGESPEAGRQPAYEQVPYENVPYEEVPYEEFDLPIPAGEEQVAAMPQAGGPAPADVPEEVQAMLQASFGAGVVLQQTDD